VCSFSKCGGCLLVSEDAPPGFPESWKGGHSSRGQTTHSFATDERDGELKGGVLPPPVYDDGDDDGGLDISGFDSDCGAPPAATTSA
jgi:hypothetical protein